MAEQVQAGGAEATIVRDRWGVPHITAPDLRGLGLGQGYAVARDRAWTIVDLVMKLRSQRARFHGCGADDANVDSDFAFLALETIPRARAELNALEPRVRELVEGFAAGINLHLERDASDQVLGPCPELRHLLPVTPADIVAQARDVIGFGLRVLPRELARARPDAAPAPGSGPQSSPGVERLRTGRSELGTNAWALGARRTEHGGGALAYNPHLPRSGQLTPWEARLTLPGALDARGASLGPLPLLGMGGYSEGLAWGVTASAANVLTLYELELEQGNPTGYVVDGEPRRMRSHAHAIEVLQADCRLATERRTLWTTSFGPVLSLEGVGWTAERALAGRDTASLVGSVNDLLCQFLDLARADSAAQVLRNRQQRCGAYGNYLVADRGGQILYTDTTAVANLSPVTLSAWQRERERPGLTQDLRDAGLVLLDGSTDESRWRKSARGRPVVPGWQAPYYAGDDVAFNSNDPPWVVHPTVRLEGFSPLYGEHRRPLSLRTREDGLLFDDVEGDRRWSLSDLQHALLSNRVLSADLLRADVQARCAGSGDPLLLRAARALNEWDGAAELGSRGVVLWDGFLAALPREVLDPTGPCWRVPFDPERPLATPTGLTAPDSDQPDPVLDALRRAAEEMEAAGLALEASPGDVQFGVIGDRRVRIHGANGALDGVLNVNSFSGGSPDAMFARQPDFGTQLPGTSRFTSLGLPVDFGATQLLVVTVGPQGPEARGLLLYEQRDEAPAGRISQLELYAEKRWRDLERPDDPPARP